MTPLPPATDAERRVQRVLVVVVALVALVAGAVPLWLTRLADDSDAAFADTEVLGTNRLGAATVDLEAGTDGAALGADNLTPGDVVTGEVALHNAGTLPLLVSIGVDGSGGPLAAWLRFDFWTAPQRCVARPTVVASVIGIGIGETPVMVLDDSGPLPRLALDVEASAVLCVVARLDIDAPNDVQDQRLVLDIVFDAEHDLEATQ